VHVKIKEPPRRLKNNKVVTTKVTFRMVDDFGDLLRETEFPFPNGKLTKTEVVLLDLDKVKEALI
jgi:hypothetical protein